MLRAQTQHRKHRPRVAASRMVPEDSMGYPRATDVFSQPRSRGPGRAAGRLHRHQRRETAIRSGSFTSSSEQPKSLARLTEAVVAALPPDRVVDRRGVDQIPLGRAAPRRSIASLAPISGSLAGPEITITGGGGGAGGGSGGGGGAAPPLNRLPRISNSLIRLVPVPEHPEELVVQTGCRRGPAQGRQSPRLGAPPGGPTRGTGTLQAAQAGAHGHPLQVAGNCAPVASSKPARCRPVKLRARPDVPLAPASGAGAVAGMAPAPFRRLAQAARWPAPAGLLGPSSYPRPRTSAAPP